MRKTRQEPYFTEVTENNRNKVGRFYLTDIQGYRILAPVTNTTDNGHKAAKSRSQNAYIIRFKSRAQKERIEKAAKQSRMTLRDFLLELAESAIAQPKAS